MRAVVVTIDTEEEGRWSSRYPENGGTCRNISRLPRVHEIFRRCGVAPTYLVDYPVVADLAARDVLRGFLADGATEIGAHLHPWCNPPFENNGAGTRATYPHNLPASTQNAKLAALCGALREAFGVKPTAYRAGRWGFDHTSIAVLERLGITVDTSVTPLWWDRSDGGPTFARAPLAPYRLDAHDECRPGLSGVIEVPLSSLVVDGHGRAVERMVRLVAPAPGLRRALVSLGLRSLRPEQYTLEQMRTLADAIAERGLRVFNVMFHSSVALPGATPYVRDERGLDEFLARLEGILQHILTRHGAVPLPLSRVPSFLGSSILTGAAA